MYSVSGPVRECRQYADDCAGRAKAQSDPVLRQELKDMQRRWLSLARSYEFSERLDSFEKNNNASGVLAEISREH
jgi:hypothetical protein